MTTKFRHYFYLGNNRAVIVEHESDNKQTVFDSLNKRQRQWITMKGENYWFEPATSMPSPILNVS